MTDVFTKASEPHDPLTQIGQQMLAEFERSLGTIKDARAIVLVSVDDRGGIAMTGYDDEDPSRAAADLFVHLRAMLRAYGRDALLIGADMAEAAQPSLSSTSTAGSASRVLSKEERRLVIDALRAAANETRRTKHNAVGDLRQAFSKVQQTHIDELSRRAGSQDRLASELAEFDLRLERTVS